MDEASHSSILQVLVDHYRNKYCKLEYDFVLHKIESGKSIAELKKRLDDANGSGKDGGDK